ncbi:DUF5454 family protein [[Mycoplasma] testudinis]|uniref:DUF5454 family protein n=1 Tax=[Mycoplasma] testudinis TaxID=33924 RepID=UPI0006981495|nr:DUF5454 family protein [[Mycoplasma] testudinis]
MKNNNTSFEELTTEQSSNVNATIDFTKEAALQNKSKWQLFLEGYKNYYHADFAWPKYIKDCKLYYGEFNIHDFIKTYGKECEEDFKQFRQRILQQKGINRSASGDFVKASNQNTTAVDDELIELMTNGDSLRTRLLIRFLSPQTKLEKKNMKRSWKNAKRSGLSRSEWMKSYVGIPFKSGKNDPQDEKYTREEVFQILKKARARLENPSSEAKTNTVKPSLVASLQPENNQDLKQESTELSTTDLSKTNYRPSKPISGDTTKMMRDYEELNSDLGLSSTLSDFQPSKTIASSSIQNINNEQKNETPIMPSGSINDAINFEKHVDNEVATIKQNRELVNAELKKANELKLAEEKRYQELRRQRQALTENLKQEDIFDLEDDDEHF